MPQLVRTISLTEWYKYDTAMRTLPYLFDFSHEDAFLLHLVLGPQAGFQGCERM